MGFNFTLLPRQRRHAGDHSLGHRRLPRNDQVLGAIALLSTAAVALALTAQYRFDMPPCVWCVLQRLLYLVIAALVLVGALCSGAARRLATLGALLVSLAGIAAALWQHFHAARQPSCLLSLADRTLGTLQLDRLAPTVFAAWAPCDQVSVILGVPFALWSCALFALLAVLLAWTLSRPGGWRWQAGRADSSGNLMA